MRRLAPLVLLFGLTGCASPTVISFETCEIELATLQPSSAAPGGVVVATGGPFLRNDQLVGDPTRDTIVTVGGLSAEVVDVASTNAEGEDLSPDCNDCFACREEADCAACGDCDGRLLPRDIRGACFGSGSGETFVPGVCDLCEQRLTFAVPEGLLPGAQSVSVLNRFGMSAAAELTVLPASTGTTSTR